MTTHSTNYRNTVITPAPDTKAVRAVEPPAGRGTVAELQYERLAGHDYEVTSDELLFEVHCARKGIEAELRAAARLAFFSTGQPCLRSSPLTKTYGWAVHFDPDGKIALLAMESPQLSELTADPDVVVRPAMRSSRAQS